jgi:hypothetical protein
MRALSPILSSSRFLVVNAFRLRTFVILLSFISPMSEAVAGTQSACAAHFDAGGSVLRGTTYSSFDEYPGVRKRTATDALTELLTKRSFAIVSSDDASGSLTATGTIGGREAQTVTFTVTPIPTGVRLSFQHRLGVGTHGRDDQVQEDLCRILADVVPIIRQRILNAPAPAAAHAVIAGERVVGEGRFVRKGRPADYLELNAGWFTTRQSGRTVRGTYEVQGDKLILTTAALAVPAVGFFISKDAIRDDEGSVWEREMVLTNDEIVNLVKADLGDDIVIAKIKNAPKVQLDVSTDALVSLKKAKVSSFVMSAMIERAARPASATPAANADSVQSKPPESAAPAVTAPPAQPCADVDYLGIIQAVTGGGQMAGWNAYGGRVRNRASYSKEVDFTWTMNARAETGTFRIPAGQYIDVNLGQGHAPPTNVRMVTCR